MKTSPKSKPIEAATTMSLEPPPPDAMDKLLSGIYNLAIDQSDLRAAKLYLDYSLRRTVEQQTGLSLEEALRLMNASASDEDSDSHAL